MKMIIDIPEEVKQAFDCAESNDLEGCYYDHGGIIGNAIKNAIFLPEEYKRMVDIDKIIANTFNTYASLGIPYIIAADKISNWREQNEINN